MLNDLQKMNHLQLNSLVSEMAFESDLPYERIPLGSTFEGKITSSTIPVKPDAKLKLSVNKSGYRIYELDF